MARIRGVLSPRPEEIAEHYASGYEAGRLGTGAGKLDRERLLQIARTLEQESSLLSVSAHIIAVGRKEE